MVVKWFGRSGWDVFAWGVGGAAIIWLLVVNPTGPPGAGAVALGLLGLLALVLRIRYPLVALVISLLAAVGTSVVGMDGIAIFTVTQVVLFSGTLRWGRAASIGPAAAVAVVLYSCVVVGRGAPPLGLEALGMIAWTSGAWGLAVAVFSQREATRSWQEHAERLRHTREEEIRRRIAEERLRIARDLHDELAHDIAVISINAGAAEAAIPESAADARRALRTVREASRKVLAELQQILGLLRTAGADDIDPRPVTNDVQTLLISARAAGLEIDAADIDLGHLTAEGRAAAYRIVQEALTNAQRHGTGTVALSAEEDTGWWRLTVRNATKPSVESSRGSGFGLIGMRERATLAGGRIRIDDGERDFGLVLELPVAEPEDER